MVQPFTNSTFLSIIAHVQLIISTTRFPLGKLITKRRVLVLLFILVSSVALFQLSLPILTESFVTPFFLKKLPYKTKHVRISDFSPFHLQGNILIKTDGKPVIEIPRFELFFSPLSFLQGKIDKMVMDHATIHLAMGENGPRLIGYSAQQPDDEKQKKPFAIIENMIFNQCRFVFHDEQGDVSWILLNADAQFTFEDSSSKKHLPSGMNIQFTTQGVVESEGHLVLEKNQETYTLRSKKIIIKEFGDLIDQKIQQDSVEIHGDLAAQFNINLTANSFAPQEFTVKLTVENFDLTKDG